MQVKNVSITSIKPYEKNPRKNNAAVDKVAASLKEFGFKQPIVTDKDGIIIAGHTRYKAALKLGLTEVPVLYAEDLTPEQVQAYRLADNKTAEFAEWDMDILAGELGELANADFDMEPFGFEQMDTSNSEIVEDEIPEPPEKPITKPGDLWQLGKHRILCGDSTVATDVERLLGGVKPLLMVTDPPYGVEYKPDWRTKAFNDGSHRAEGEVSNDSKADWREAWVLFPGDVAYVWHAGRHASAVQQSLEAADFEIRCQIIWAKTRFAISRGHYHWQHEPCWYAVRKNGKGHWSGDRSQTTLWHIDHNKSDTGHGTQKPVECMARPIKNNSSPGQAVYDPFVGSGTTLIAAEQLGRVCYAMELDPKYCDVIIQRWEEFTGEKAELIGK